ncbi:MAG: type II secretion system F family protein [bacterium]
MFLYLLSALVGLTVLLAGVGIVQMTRGEDRVAQRLQRIRGVMLGPSESLEKALGGGSLPFWAYPLKFLSYALPGRSDPRLLRWELAAAGIRHMDAPRVFTGFRMVTAAACGFAATFAGPWFNLNRNEGILAVVVAALAGFMLPWLLVRMGQRRRREEITLALPDALDLMVICVEAGQGLNAALMSVSRESVTYSPALSDEFRLMNLEMSTGLPRAQALKNLALRTGIDDVRALVAVLVQSDRFGTSIGQALRTHAQSLRTRRRQRAEEQARKTPVKMVFPLVFCVFPALLVVILAPGVIELIRALRDVNG